MPPKESFITIVHHEGESVGRIDWSNGAAPAGRQKQRAGAESGHLDQDRGTPIAAPAMLFCPAAPWRGQKRGFFSLNFGEKTLAFVLSMGVGPEKSMAGAAIGVALCDQIMHL